MKKTNKTIIKSSPTLSMSADAQGHIRAEAVRFTQLTGAVTSDDDALEGIVSEHAELHRLLRECFQAGAPYVDSVGSLVRAIADDTVRLVESDEDTSLYRFRLDVLEALQDPVALQSAQALSSRIGMLGIANGWWVNAKTTTEPTA